MRTAFFACVFLLSVCTSSSGGAEWVYFIENEAGEKFAVDLESISHVSAGVIRVTTRVERQQSPVRQLSIRHHELDCGDARIRLMKETMLLKDGQEKPLEVNGQWQSVTPEDIEETLLELVCSLKKTGNS